MEENNVLLKQWCIEQDVDFEIALRLTTKILALIDKAHSILGNLFDNILMRDIKGTAQRQINIAFLLLTHRKLVPILQKLTPKELTALSLHNQILPIMEGILLPEINFLIYTIINNGKDFYHTYLRKNVTSLDDIETASLSSRLEFLKKNEFEYISQKVDVKFRNSIAHMFYKIKEDGSFYINNHKYDTEKIYRDIRSIAYSIHFAKKLYYRIFS
jgi:hypothetical protein